MNEPSQILKKVFGYDCFRPFQEEIINSVLSKRDTLAVMPTGGGKSLCYQLPALIFDGLTIVVSPLISLMKDQVDQLKQLGISAVMLNSSLTPEVYYDNIKMLKKQMVKLLYIAPESLCREEMTDLFSEVKVDCLTIDEAHCISEWGHDFRPEYRELGNLRNYFPEAACLALTATATPRVQSDIIKSLNFKNNNKFVSSFDRNNLFLQVRIKNNPLKQMLEFLKEHKEEPGIIYCATRKQVDDLTAFLAAKGYSVLPYHAGLEDFEREKTQNRFSRDDIQIVVATVAFGMGINKSNVRFVLHYDLPKNLESYYQEIGRSGRDGLPADCILLFGYGDIVKINYFIDQKENEHERRIAKMLLTDMIQFAETKVCRRMLLLSHFGERRTEENCGMCDNCTEENKLEGPDNITIEAKKFLSCVKRTGELFGATHLVDVLLGKYNDKIDKFGHHKLSVFGIGKEHTKEQWLDLITQFTQNGLISREAEFGSIKLTAKAASVLFKGMQIKGTLNNYKLAKTAKKNEYAGSYNNDLFQLLREKRKALADSENVPPYVIFSDKTLIELSSKMPLNDVDLLKINGIGEVKLKRYGKIFLEIIQQYKNQ